MYYPVGGWMIQFEVLGSLQVRRDGLPVRLTATMLRRLLAVLLTGFGDAMSMDLLADSLWSGTPPRTARKTVQIYVHRLRSLLDHEELITYGSDGYRLVIPSDNALDAMRFEEMVRRARKNRQVGEAALARDTMHAALALWRGPAFADVPDLAVAQAAIHRLTEWRLVAWEERAELDLVLGQHVDLACDLWPLIAEYPFRERLREHLMLALYRCGRVAASLEVYRETRKLFDDELGVSPGRRLQDLHQAILRSDPRLDYGTDQITTSEQLTNFSTESR
jgi:DNA-binding SARP family transcriptional activator